MVSALALVSGPFQSSSLEPNYIIKPDSSSAPASFMADNSTQMVNFSQSARGLSCEITNKSLNLKMILLSLSFSWNGKGLEI